MMPWSGQAQRLQPLRGFCCLPVGQPSPISSGETAEGGLVTDATDGQFTEAAIGKQEPEAGSSNKHLSMAVRARPWLLEPSLSVEIINSGVVLINDACQLDFDSAD